jgi:hypothetical protein
MYSSILAWRTGKRSVCERSSITKAGHKCQYPARLSSGSFPIASFGVHDASGDRRAPLGSRKPVEESAAIPRASFRAQLPSCMAISRFLAPVVEKFGGMTMISSSTIVSKDRSGCLAQKSANCRSVIGGAVSVAGM